MTTIGVHAGLQRTTTAELIALWQRIEGLGFGWISVWDHFYAADGTEDANCLEAVSMHAALACHTTKVRAGCLVYCAGYRHPAVLANAIATVDHLSGGRADIGLGAGWSQIEYEAYGIPFPAPRVRLDILEESARAVRGLLHDDHTTFAGQHFTLTNARCDPKPIQAKLPVWIGGGGEKRTLKIVARYADGWNVPFIPPEQFAHKRGVLHEHCERIGRDPAEIRCSVNVGLAFTDDDLRAQFGNIAEFVRPGVLTGSDDEIVDRIGQYVDAGAEQVNIAIRSPFDPEALDRLADLLGLRTPAPAPSSR